MSINAIINNFKRPTRITTNLLNNCSILSRGYRKINEYKINWVRPKQIPFVSPERSGDLGLKVDIKSADLGKEYNDLPELQE